jgi:CHASE3 domain sensor protein
MRFLLLLVLLILLAVLFYWFARRAAQTADGVNEVYTTTHVGAH